MLEYINSILKTYKKLKIVSKKEYEEFQPSYLLIYYNRIFLDKKPTKKQLNCYHLIKNKSTLDAMLQYDIFIEAHLYNLNDKKDKIIYKKLSPDEEFDLEEAC